MTEEYKGHSITASAWEILDTQQWEPRLVIIWQQQGAFPVKAPNINKFFSTREKAESEGLSFAKKWIDDGKPDVF